MKSADMNEVFRRLGEEEKPLLDEHLTEEFRDEDVPIGPARLNHHLELNKDK